MQPIPEALAENYAAKSDEELRTLHAAGTLTPVAYEVLERELKARGVAVPERPDAAQLEAEARSAYARITLAGHWRGKAPLASAYWLVGTLGFWAVYGAVILTKILVPVLMPVALAVLVAFFVFAWVSIWRCWRNTSWPVWGYVARAIVVLDAVIVLAIAVRLVTLALAPKSVIP